MHGTTLPKLALATALAGAALGLTPLAQAGVDKPQSDPRIIGVLQHPEIIGVLNTPRIIGVLQHPEIIGVLQTPRIIGVLQHPEIIGVLNTPRIIGVLQHRQIIGVLKHRSVVITMRKAGGDK